MGREVWDLDFSDHRADDSYQEMHDRTLIDPRDFPTSSSSSRDHRGDMRGDDDEIDITARHALVLGGVVVLLIISFLAYLLCRKNPSSSSASAANPPLPPHHHFPTTRYGYGGQQGDRRQLEEDLPPSYNQLEQMDLLRKSEELSSVPPPSYEEINKEGMV